jgi:hypothetical protein
MNSIDKRISMKYKIILIVSLILVVLLNIIVLIQISRTRKLDLIDSFNIHSTSNSIIADRKFLEQNKDILNINRDLKVFADHPIFGSSNDKYRIYEIGVLNYGKESIVFINEGFGIQFFSFYEEKWNIIETDNRPVKRNFILDPETTEFDYDNVWILNVNSLIKKTDNVPIRILVTGVGEDSEDLYGAYVDLLLTK